MSASRANATFVTKAGKDMYATGSHLKQKSNNSSKWTDRRIFTEACMAVARPVLIITYMCGELETNETLMMTLVKTVRKNY